MPINVYIIKRKTVLKRKKKIAQLYMYACVIENLAKFSN